MKNLKVVETLPSQVEWGCASLLYNQPNFLIGNNQLPQLHFYLVDLTQRLCLGHIGFSLLEGQALSPYRAPFGGFTMSPDLDSETITFFIFEVLRRLEENGVQQVELKNAPDCYYKKAQFVSGKFAICGFGFSRKSLSIRPYLY